MPNKHIIGLGELMLSNRRDEELVTYSLGSCLGVTAFDPVAGVGAMIHCMLPLSSANGAKAVERPGMFVDTGMTLMLKELFGLGAQRANLQIRAAGAGNMMDPQKHFNIGERNYTVLRKILWKNNLLIASEDIGGNVPRTMHLVMETGQTLIRREGAIHEL